MIRVTFTGDDGVSKSFGAAPKLIEQAMRTTIGRTAKRLEQDLEIAASKEFDIPKPALAKFRIKSKRVGNAGQVWFGYNAMKSGYVGRLKQFDWGASSRGYLFKGGFVAEMKSGHKGVFLRVGPKRLMTKGRFEGKKRQPIEEQKVSILRSPALANQVMLKTGDWYKAELAKAITKQFT